MDDDVTINVFCDYLAFMDPSPPLCEKLDRWGTKYYKNQKAHVLAWFASKDENASTKSTYNRLQNPGMLVWISCVFGVSPEEIEKASGAALEAERTDFRKSCKAFRDVIPFDRIFCLLSDPKKWQYDKDLLSITKEDESGMRSLLPRKDGAFNNAIEKLFV